MRRISWALILITLLTLAWPAVAGAAASKSFVWQSLETDVQVLADGRLHVTETITLRYAGGPFTFVKRNLASAHLDEISEIAVRDADQAYQPVDERNGKTPYTFSVFREDGVKTVRWVYPPTSDGERTFVLSYTVIGALARGSAGDELWWPLVFPARDEIVERAVGRIQLPAAVPAAQMQARMPDFQGELTLEPGRVSVSAANIPPDEKLTVLVQFPTGVASGGKPAWQAAAEEQQEYNATTRPKIARGLAGGFVAATLALFALLRAWWMRRRDPASPVGGAPSEIADPPEDLAPALAAHLAGSSDAQAVSATLFDLTRRGYLSLVESRGGWFKTRQVSAVRSDKPADDLLPFETEALDVLFDGETEVDMGKRSTAIQKALGRLGKEHRRALLELGYLDQSRLQAKNRATIFSLLLMLVSLAGVFVGFVFAKRMSFWLPAIPALLFVGSIVWMILAAVARGVTPAGAEALGQWRAFAKYLKRLRPERAPLGQFETLLPYAAALGDAGRFIKVFKQSNEPLPAWFHPLGEDGASDAWAGVSEALLLRDYSDSFSSTAVIIAATSGGGAGAGAGGGSAG